ncbi:DUF3252 domain-containing protein [Candidatus Saccharibacteria bacterium]|nr:DUF3252 domain-containing protein [Candidatus Saccharibacteria bacterium]
MFTNVGFNICFVSESISPHSPSTFEMVWLYVSTISSSIVTNSSDIYAGWFGIVDRIDLGKVAIILPICSCRCTICHHAKSNRIAIKGICSSTSGWTLQHFVVAWSTLAIIVSFYYCKHSITR